MESLNGQRLLFVKLIFLCLLMSCDSQKQVKDDALFQLVPTSVSSIEFNNQLEESEDFNIIEYLYFYNGGGVAIGDINNDGLADVYFSGNQVSNRLYLNKGDFKFEDITEKAGVTGKGNWKTGVTMADVNADGLLDIYVCGVGNYKKFTGLNQLFINNGDLTFSEKSKELGLDFQGFSTQSAFLDYDLDGDLDMYLLNHSVHSQRSYGKVSLRDQVDSLAGDRLYQNQYSETGKTFFKNVTATAGIYSSQIGYGLGIGISDINCDGYPDMYISNDFHENDYLYINQKNGTFIQESSKSFAHQSRFSMGNDIADINNDGWADIITLDMMPRSESVIKTSAGEDSYEVYKYKLSLGYGKQVSRNTLQINRGPLLEGKSIVFTDVATAAGIEATDWSWSPLMVDFDGDGWKDIFISNGIVKRPNDLDYINFISSDSIQNKFEIIPWLGKMPEGKVSNFIFKNQGNLNFEDKTINWGLSLPSFSNGAAYGDLDNDGDPDLIVNRINELPLVYKNNSQANRFLKIKLVGDSISGNRFAIGAKVTITQDSMIQMQELFPTRGWCSSSDYSILFGIPDYARSVDVQVIWPDGKMVQEKVKGPDAILKYSASLPDYKRTDSVSRLLEFTNVINYKHQEDAFNAFNREGLIPHMLTTEGPPITKADVNGDQLEDIFVGGARGQAGSLFLQIKDGKFSQLSVPDFERDREAEDVGASFFDADGDGDNDLIVVSGGQEEVTSSNALLPRLYLNNGKGILKRSLKSIPTVHLQASCVKPADYDQDGDIDLFIGAGVMPMLYGMSPISYLFTNDGKGNFSTVDSWLGTSVFDNITKVRPGMIKDAAWVDVDEDGRLDLVVVGEWMPITILLQQADHTFKNATIEYGLTKTRGWWNTIYTDDFDGDGDDDLVVGNQGLNFRIHATPDAPLKMYVGDFDSNGGTDHILVYNNNGKNYPLPSRDQLVKQIPSLKKYFLSYKDYRDVALEDIITPQQKGNSTEMIVDSFTSLYLRNNGQSFTPIPLPFEAQLFPIFAIHSEDLDGDGFKDLMLAGNLTATQPDLGPDDGGIGLVMKGNGKGQFTPLTAMKSGFFVPGEGREIVAVKDSRGKKIYLVSRNNDTVLSFSKK